jgi:hypothetical protein
MPTEVFASLTCLYSVTRRESIGQQQLVSRQNADRAAQGVGEDDQLFVIGMRWSAGLVEFMSRTVAASLRAMPKTAVPPC